jgi:Ca-activated chloride channel family protein
MEFSNRIASVLRRPPFVLPLALLWTLAAPSASPAVQEIPTPPDAAAAAADPAALAPRYREWLDEVALLITPKERETFLGLQKDYQRDTFERRFWEVRDPFPQTPANEFKDRWDQSSAIARKRLGNLTEDRAHMVLFNGEPREVFPVRCDVLMPLEIWSFAGAGKLRGEFTLVFVQRGSLYRLWSPQEGIENLLSLDLRAKVDEPGRALAAIAELCPRGEDISSRLGEAVDWDRVATSLHLIPHPGEEWLSTFSSYSTDVPAGALPFPARLDLSFPSRFGSRTVLQGLVTVPREAVKPERIEGSPESFYSFLVDGEVLYKGELFEHFRYRFTLPQSQVAGAEIPVVFQRYLRPGSYSLILKIEDMAEKRYFREERELAVPAVDAVAAEVPAAGGASSATPQAALAEANAALGSGDQTVHIVPPLPGLATGKLRVEATATGAGVAKVTFELDGKPVLTKGRPPYSVELNLGFQPRTHLLRAVAQDAGGKKLAEDELALNVGPHRFAVRLVEPQAGKTYQSSLRAEARVEVPEGERLDRLELYLNDDKMATLYQPPFTQALLLPKGGKEITYVRAVAYLDGGNSTEDLVLVNGPEYTQKVNVQLVELYTSVVDPRGRPVDGLAKGDFTVSEDGQKQEIRRFERVRDVPIYAGILLDTSASMSQGDKLDSALKGALSFFDKVITPKDRAAVITFADHPNLAVRFTNQPAVLAGGLAGLTATGNTTLYDSLIYTLYYFGGIKGKRAIILLSDGKDEGSRFSYEDALEYARRAGVTIYTIGLGKEVEKRKMEKIAEETGGRSFFVQNAAELDAIYSTIEKELRSQYLIAYQSGNTTGANEFRTVDLKVSQPGVEAKTMRGYYP